MKPQQNFVLIDDDPESIMLNEVILRSFAPKAAIEVFSELEKALIYLLKTFCNTREKILIIVLLEIDLSGLNHVETLDQLYKFSEDLEGQLKIIALTSKFKDRHKKSMIRAYNQYFIEKPLTLEKLESSMKSSLGSNQSPLSRKTHNFSGIK